MLGKNRGAGSLEELDPSGLLSKGWKKCREGKSP